MNSPLARYLRDFGAEKVLTPAEVHFEAPSSSDAFDDFPAIEHVVEQVDVEAERQQAREEGARQATEELTAQHAEAIAELQQKHADELEAQRQEFEGGLADYLAKALPELTDRLAAELTEAALRLFAPIVKEELDRQALNELAATLRTELAKETLEQIQVSGPERLCDLLRDRLEEAGATIEFQHTEGADVRVEMGDSLLVTRLSAFTADLERVLA